MARDGVFVGGENTLAVFALDPANGEPRPIQHIDTRGIHCRNFHIDPSGRLLVASHIMGLSVQATAAADGSFVPACLSRVPYRATAASSISSANTMSMSAADRCSGWAWSRYSATGSVMADSTNSRVALYAVTPKRPITRPMSKRWPCHPTPPLHPPGHRAVLLATRDPEAHRRRWIPAMGEEKGGGDVPSMRFQTQMPAQPRFEVDTELVNDRKRGTT